MTAKDPPSASGCRTQSAEQAPGGVPEARASEYGARMRNAAGTRDPETLPHGHGCGARWAGANTAHCTVCCRTFSGVSTFDAHRRGGACADPATIGLALLPGRAYDVWGHTAEVTP